MLCTHDFPFNIDLYDCIREEEDRDDETDTGRESSAYVKPDIEELEMLVEAYFVQIDGTLNKLMANVLTHPLLGDE